MTPYEMKALEAFQSDDQTRPHLNTVWAVTNEDGEAHFATNSHVMVLRRSGKMRELIPADLPAFIALNPESRNAKPPTWEPLLRANAPGKLADRYAFSFDYMAVIGGALKAAKKLARDSWAPPPGLAKKHHADRRYRDVESSCVLTWSIPSDPLAGWFFVLDTPQARWEGVLMPVRTVMP